MEFSSIDGKENGGFSLASIYVTARLTWDGIRRSPQSRTHISATSGIDAVNLLCLRTEDTIIDDDLGVGILRIHNGVFMLIGVIACIADQFVLCHIIRTVKHHVLAGVPICDSFIRSMVSSGTDTIHTTCSCTKDTAEDIALLGVVFWKNLEGSAIDGDGAVAIEWVVDIYFAVMSTTHTTAIKFGNDNAGIIYLLRIIAFPIFRTGWV